MEKPKDNFLELFDVGALDEFIGPKGHLLESVKKDKAMQFICDIITKYPNYAGLKNHLDLLRIVVNFIENLIINKKDNINKLDLAIDIYKKVFNPLQPNEIELLKANIEFLNRNRLIKRISKKKRIRKWFYDTFKSFFSTQ